MNKLNFLQIHYFDYNNNNYKHLTLKSRMKVKKGGFLLIQLLFDSETN